MKLNLLATFCLILIIFGCSMVSVQGQSQAQPSAQIQSANELLKAQKWTEAAAAYEAILKTEPNNINAWYQLATVRYTLKQYPQAAAAFQKNVEINNGGFAMYNLACVYSLMGEKEKALEWLAKTADNPKMVLQAINFNDPDFANIKDDARFKALTDKVTRKTRPCMYSEEAKQFNFWVGEWDVYNPQGRHDGNSVIQSIANGCGVLENWRDTFGDEGKSLNFYDSETGKWYQYWMGSNGAPVRLAGVYKDGALRYEGAAKGASGQNNLTRLTFFNIDANTVRQLGESSSDDGKTWTTTFDYKYVRKTTKN